MGASGDVSLSGVLDDRDPVSTDKAISGDIGAIGAAAGVGDDGDDEDDDVGLLGPLLPPRPRSMSHLASDSSAFRTRPSDDGDKGGDDGGEEEDAEEDDG